MGHPYSSGSEGRARGLLGEPEPQGQAVGAEQALRRVTATQDLATRPLHRPSSRWGPPAHAARARALESGETPAPGKSAGAPRGLGFELQLLHPPRLRAPRFSPFRGEATRFTRDGDRGSAHLAPVPCPFRPQPRTHRGHLRPTLEREPRRPGGPPRSARSLGPAPAPW